MILDWRVILWCLLIFIFIYAGVRFETCAWKATKEGFEVNKTIDEQIMDVYEEILHRQPSSEELIEARREIGDLHLTLEGLRQRLIDSEEYGRYIKLQSNVLSPELTKMISDRALLDLIAQIYLEEKKRKVPEKMLLPLRDIYIELDYNEYAFRAFLRDKKYDRFEDDLIHAQNMDKEALLAKFNKTFDKKELRTKGAEIAKEMEAKRRANAANNARGASSITGPVAANSNGTCRTVNDKDSDMSCALTQICKNAQCIFDKDKAASAAFGADIPTHTGDMVLRPEFAWMVPQPRAPVCTTLGQPALTQPVMTDSKLLLGTPLDEAANNTGVGSIMPRFEYKEYVHIPCQAKHAEQAK